MRTRARFPGIDPAAGHYESFYLKASHPGGGSAVWIRHTVHQRPGAPPTASVWFVLFGDGAPIAAKATVDSDLVSAPADAYLEVDGSRVGPCGMTGHVAAGDVDARWDLAFSERAPGGLRHLPAPWMYERGFPRTKVESPHPSVAVNGELRLGERTVALEDWPGIVGHNWGSEHAARWIWLQSPLRDYGYLDIAAGRIGVGSRMTPWKANDGLLLDGVSAALGGPGRLHVTRIDADTGRCSFVIGGPGIRVRGRIHSPPGSIVGWRYADPDGGEHQVTNCSVADLVLTVERRGQDRPDLHVVRGAAAYELGTREPQPTVPMQPFPDG